MSRSRAARCYIWGARWPLNAALSRDGIHWAMALTLEDRPRPQGYADPKIFPRDAPFNEDFWGPVVVPKKGDVLELNASTYPRWATFIGREGHMIRREGNGTIAIDGKVSSTYTVEHNYVFGMGDNRDNSLDGRFWGFIPEENIVGTPMIVYWSWDPDAPFSSIVSKLASVRLGRVGTIIK